MRRELRPPLALGDMGEGQPVALPLDADGQQSNAGPGIEPPMQQPQLGARAGRELEEGKVGTE
jgi:hypothetical protein